MAKKRKRGRKKGLGSTATNGKKADLKQEVPQSFAIIGGLLLGRYGGKLLDKLLPLNPGGGFQIKAIIKPVLQAGAGLGAVVLGNKLKSPVARFAGYGLMGSALVSTVKVAFNKDLLSGLGDTETKSVTADYYTENKEDLVNLLQQNSFRAALPEQTGTSGVGDTNNESDYSDII